MEFLSRLLGEICSPNLGTTGARWGLSDVTGETQSLDPSEFGRMTLGPMREISEVLLE